MPRCNRCSPWPAARAGAVYVFTRSGTTWSQRSYVKATNTEAGDNFGRSVGVWFNYLYDTLLVGAPFEASSATGINNGNQADDSATGAGASYLY
jgi:hypothetical protein